MGTLFSHEDGETKGSLECFGTREINMKKQNPQGFQTTSKKEKVSVCLGKNRTMGRQESRCSFLPNRPSHAQKKKENGLNKGSKPNFNLD